MNHYELLVILPGTLSEDEVTPHVAAVTDVLTQQGVQGLETEDQGKSRLAYPMRHIRYGYFRIFRFTAEPAAVVAIQKKLNLMRDLLRVLLTKYDADRVKEAKERLAAAAKRSTMHRRAQVKTEEREQPAERPQRPKKETKEPVKEVKMEDINKKLDELIEQDIAKEL